MAASLVGGSVSRASVIVLLAVLLLAATPVLPAGANPHRQDTVVGNTRFPASGATTRGRPRDQRN